MSATAHTVPLGQVTPKQDRKVWIKNKRGDLMGGNFTIPKGDFARFLGWKPETEEEKRGKISGSRTLEVAVQKQMNELGKSAMQRGMAYRNMYISWGRFTNEPGREKDLIASGLDAIKNSAEMGHAMGIRYLEMQYKFHLASKNFGCISNLMKTRHETVKKSINEVR